MSELKASNDPLEFAVVAAGEKSSSEASRTAGLADLVSMARAACDAKRRKQCLALVSAILKLDPQHAEAIAIQTTVFNQLDREFERAKALAADARLKNDRRLYEQAQALLHGVVDADEERSDAQSLLLDTVSAAYFLDTSKNPAPVRSVGQRELILGGATALLIVVILILVFKRGADSPPSMVTPAQSAPLTTPAAPESSRAMLAKVDLIVAPLNGVHMTVDSGPSTPVPNAMELQPGEHRFNFSADGYLPESVLQTVRAGERQTVVVALTPATKRPATAAAARAEQRPIEPSQAPAAPLQQGGLAVSSSLPVEIYEDGRDLGTTPITLQLAAGPHTLEYRYQTLRQTRQHIIKPNETATTAVTFSVSLQINARPWAQVFVDGSPATALGETPLSNVTVPVGSVLIFRNPGFPDKTYRVTGKDSTLQIAFP
jgi:hypothetical protein